MAVSANYTSVKGTTGTITDNAGHVWAINAAGKVTVDGKVDDTTGFVVQIAFVNGKVWQENINFDWWSKTSPTDQWAGGIHFSPLPYYPTTSGKIGPLTDKLVDLYGNNWTMVQTDLGNKVAVNGVVDNTTAYVINLWDQGGIIYQENINNDWWAKSSNKETWTYVGKKIPGSDNGGVTQNHLSYATDATGNQWSIDTNQKVTVNGVTDQTTDQVLKVLVTDGKVWQENINGDWWYKTNPADTWAAAGKAGPDGYKLVYEVPAFYKVVTSGSPGSLYFLSQNPQPNTLLAPNFSGTLNMHNGDEISLTSYSNKNITVHMGEGTESLNSDSFLIYGGSGSAIVNAFTGLRDIRSLHISNTMTFIGGSGDSLVYDVNVGYGGPGNTVLVGNDGSHLYAGTGHTDFGIESPNDIVNIMSFVKGLDHIDFQFGGDMLAKALAGATYANGVETIATGGAGMFLVHTETALTISDFKLTTST